MKKDIHPTYYSEAVITCTCGAALHTGSTEEKILTEVCSQCHPFYSGKKKLMDSTGRVDRFKKITEEAQKRKAVAEKIKVDKEKREANRTPKAEKETIELKKKKTPAAKKSTKPKQSKVASKKK